MFVNHVHLMPAWLREDGTLDAYLRLADSLGFEGAVCFAPFSYQVGDRIPDHNAWLAETIKDRSNLVGYGTLDPAKPAADQVKHIADLGLRGIKLHPAAQKFHIRGPWAMEAYTAMTEHSLIADFHLGVHWHRLSDYNPLDCDEIAHELPGLRMVYEHVGGWHYYRQVLAVIINNQHRGNHLYAGIASVLNREHQRYWYLGVEGLEDCRWQIGDDLLIYGLDFPYNQQPQIEGDLAQIRQLDWPAETIAGLLGGNLRRLLFEPDAVARRAGGDPNPKKAAKK